jgi:hypothetical protein
MRIRFSINRSTRRMATDHHLSQTSNDAAILARLIHPEQDNLPATVARVFLDIRFGSDDIARIEDLLARNQHDALTASERADLESYLRVGSFLDLMHAKARRSLKKLH